MLFDPNPKIRVEDLFDREKELRVFRDALKRGERLIVVYGLRRVGKTSFIRVALRAYRYPHVVIDVREIYYSYRRITNYHIYRAIADYFTDNLKFFERIGYHVGDILRRVRGLRLKGVEVEVEPTRLPSIASLLRHYNKWAGRRGTRFVLVFDEAQYLRYSGAVKFDGLFAWCVDNLENLTIVLSGSEVGLLRDFLRVEDPQAPLYGRYIHEIKLENFTENQSIAFLEEGFRELGVEISREEAREVVARLGRVPGWLTLYGYYRGVLKLDHREALEKVYEEGVKLVYEELEKIIEPSRDRYLAILEAITRGATKWSQIKTYVAYRTGPLTDKRFNDLLKKLVKYSVVEKHREEYRITDPIVEYAVRKASTR